MGGTYFSNGHYVIYKIYLSITDLTGSLYRLMDKYYKKWNKLYSLFIHVELNIVIIDNDIIIPSNKHS